MTLWFFLSLMTLAAVFAVLWPLSRSGSAVRSGSDVAVYRDQLAELARDRAAGLIGEAEGEAARVEVARRLLAAADTPARAAATASATWRRRAVLLAGLFLLPLGAVAIYLALGSPHLPGAPLHARSIAPAEDASLSNLISQVEGHLERRPDDGRGWEVIAPVYLRLGRFADAVRARRNALQLNGATAAREADLGEALIAAANGVVTAEAKAAFERALALDAGDFKARYFLGLAAEQDGQPAQAAAQWRDLLAAAPPDASWTELVRESLARVTPPVAGAVKPGADDMAAIQALPDDQRNAMIEGMVERLAGRLKDDGDDVEGWLRLVRAYVVLKDPAKARAAAAAARKALNADAEKARRIDDLVKTLGLEG